MLINFFLFIFLIRIFISGKWGKNVQRNGRKLSFIFKCTYIQNIFKVIFAGNKASMLKF